MAARQQNVESVTVNVDPMRCARYGLCEREAPAVFQIRDDGRLSYKASVTVDELNPVVRAVEVCPARAIALGKMPSSMLVQSRGHLVEEAPPQETYPTSPGVGPIRPNGRVSSLAARRRRSTGGRR